MWRCEYVNFTLGPTLTAQYKCGAGPLTPFPGFGGMCRRTVNTPTYHRWEYRSENQTGGTIEEVTIECDLTKVPEGKGPCPYVTYYYKDLFGLEVGFGPILMDLRACDCIDSPDPIPLDSVGYNWGTAYVTADAINAADQSAYACQLSLTSGDDSSAICLCSACACYGFSPRMRLKWECVSFPADVVINLNFFSAASLPAGASSPGTSLPYGIWWGETTIFGCRFEAMLRCDPGNVGPSLWLLTLRDAVIGDPCDIVVTACSTPNRYVISYQCRTATTPYKIIYGYCSMVVAAGACPGTIVSTITIEEQP